MKNRAKDLRQIDEALARMDASGGKNSVHYANLVTKRTHIASGAPYDVVDVTEPLIAAVARLIPGTVPLTRRW